MVLPTNDDAPYLLHIWEITGDDANDTYLLQSNNKNYPNGIIIPEDWKWPLETEEIFGPYPAFYGYIKLEFKLV